MHELETMTLAELAEVLKVSRWTVRRIAERDPTFPRPYRIGQQKRWRVICVHRWMESTRAACPDRPQHPEAGSGVPPSPPGANTVYPPS